MKFSVERNWVEVVGTIWMPSVTAAMRYDLSAYDVANIGTPTRENVEDWLSCHSGDFQHVADFHAIVGETEIPWQSEENECVYWDCMEPVEA